MSHLRLPVCLLLAALPACNGTPTDAGGPPFEILLGAAPLGNHDIYAMTADGVTMRRLTDHTGDDMNARWSPDRERIVFVTNRDTALIGGQWRRTQEIYVMQADGSGLVRLTHDTVPDDLPDWSPDGQKIVFSRYHNLEFNLFVISPNGSDLTQLDDGSGDASAPRWSPDGTHVAFSSTRTGRTRVHIMNAAGGQPPASVAHPSQYSGENVTAYAWSPTGGRMVVAVSTGTNAVNLFTVDIVAGGIVTQLTNDANRENTSPAWAPDGALIAFSTNRDNPAFDIHVVSAATGSNQQLLVTGMASAYVADWKRRP